MEKALNEYFICDGKKICVKDFNEEDIISKNNIYEVIRVIDGVPLFLKEHMDRMKKSFSIMGIEQLFNYEDLNKVIDDLVTFNNRKEGNIKVVYAADRNRLSSYYIPYSYPKENLYKEGVHTIAFHGERENPNAKVINNGFREKVNEAIEQNNAYEAILIDNEGRITEGSRSNIFMIMNNTVITSPVEAVLPGVTRAVIMKVCGKLNLNIEEREVHEEELKDLQGLFISGTSPKVLPIKSVDSIIYNSYNNPIILSIIRGYENECEEYIKTNK
ncbi:aminotransferase class IV [Clostridium hydrogeniformans]|uniref:aminotransferase class IV n=1 Tax=Clostridium hydrogeniformans TaxID=349933 RepID=UPI00047FAB11|nr:aminotransferase class IV [Clostridium hydrogeniformans]